MISKFSLSSVSGLPVKIHSGLENQLVHDAVVTTVENHRYAINPNLREGHPQFDSNDSTELIAHHCHFDSCFDFIKS